MAFFLFLGGRQNTGKVFTTPTSQQEGKNCHQCLIRWGVRGNQSLSDLFRSGDGRQPMKSSETLIEDDESYLLDPAVRGRLRRGWCWQKVVLLETDRPRPSRLEYFAGSSKFARNRRFLGTRTKLDTSPDPPPLIGAPCLSTGQRVGLCERCSGGANCRRIVRGTGPFPSPAAFPLRQKMG